MVDLTQIYCAGRIGQCGDWSFIVECVGSEGWALDPATSRGSEVLIFDPRLDDPPSFFTCLADGALQPHFEMGFGYDSAGTQPDLLRPALESAGAIPPEGSVDELLGEDEELPPLEQKPRLLAVVGEHARDCPQPFRPARPSAYGRARPLL
ncbi:DUF6461 domain-containing protein [Streptomyces kanamyceticus]|uniref:Uncharacterized protein n=1 Tax=Streptomyces kanamyceticus TaxID=1967 RepID=A0A5J6G4M0_STRKN|nr:DUF6461 domain-containing protein [Streptomyces kanamyceticus]QEU89873.1 hypothetical protein CP970_02045 [Streptomyces kanamyceticus]